MSDRLDDAELDRLEGLHAAATPGPWKPSEYGSANEIDSDGTASVLEGGPVNCMAYCYGGSSVVEFSEEDHAVTIAARNALPTLLAELRKHRVVEAVHMAALIVDNQDEGER